MRKQGYARKVFVVMGMLLAQMALPAFQSPAQAQMGTDVIFEASCAPDTGTARITGKVTGNGGVALQNVQVTAYTLIGDRGGVANTNASGVYTITNLIGSNYFVEFNPQFVAGAYTSEWYGDKPTPTNATPVLVNTGSTVANINNQLPTGGQIRGIVQGAGAGLLQSVQVSVYDSTGNRVAGAFTNAAGVYTTTPGLAAGNYRVQFDGTNGFIGQYFSNKSTQAAADLVNIPGPGLLTNINATLARGGAITGKVTHASNGLPVSSVYVSAYGQSGGNGDYTDGTGNFSIAGLPSGIYQVSTNDNDDALIDTAQSITVTAPNTVTNANFALAAGGAITGRVVNTASAPLNSISVYISNQDGSYQNYVSTNASGIYKATGLPTGQFTVHFRPNQFIPELYDNRLEGTGQADPVSVTAPFTVTNINAELARGAVISGTVTDAITGLPIKDVFVEVLGANGDRVESDSTDANGKYEMPPTLPTGSYKVRFNADERFASCAYVTEYNNDKLKEETADLIPLNAPNVVVVNAALSRGSIIIGKVTDALTGAPVTEGSIRVYDAAGKNVMFGRLTFLGGYHTTAALPTGSYRVEITDYDDGGYIDEFWNDKPSLVSADSLNLTAPNDAVNINFAVAKGGTISGKVTASDTGAPFTQGSIQVYDANGAPVGYADIDPDGTYRVMNGLPTGNYRVAVVPYGFDGPGMMAMTNEVTVNDVPAPAQAEGTAEGTIEATTDAVAVPQGVYDPSIDQAVPVFIPETEITAVPETTPEVIAPAEVVAEATDEPAMPKVTPGKVIAGSFQVNAGASSSSYLPTFFGGTVITGPANVAVTSPNNTVNINITVKRGVLIPNVQR